MKCIILRRPLSSPQDAHASDFQIHLYGYFLAGDPLFLGVDGEPTSSPTERAQSLGLSSQNWLPDSSSIQPSPTRLWPSAHCFNWVSITNPFTMLIAGNKKNKKPKLVCPYGGLVSGVENYLKEKNWRRKSSSSDRKKTKKQKKQVRQNEERCYSQ